MEKEIKINSENTTIPETSNEVASLCDEVKHLEEAVKQLAEIPQENLGTKNLALLAVVALALLAVLVVGYYMFLRVPKKEIVPPITQAVATTTITATNTTTITPVTIEVYKDSNPWYDVSIEYPNLPIVKDFIMQQYEAFTSDTKILTVKNQSEAKEVLGLESPDWKYTFSTTVKSATSSDITSYIFETYTFTGGAHGSTQVTAISLDKDGKTILVNELLKDKDLTKIATIARQQILAEKKKRLSAGGVSQQDIQAILDQDEMLEDGIKPVRENYSVAWLDGEDVVVHFGQYQVGAYVEGMYDIRIKKTILGL